MVSLHWRTAKGDHVGLHFKKECSFTQLCSQGKNTGNVFAIKFKVQWVQCRFKERKNMSEVNQNFHVRKSKGHREVDGT